MLNRERQAYILHKINLRNKVLSADLNEDINVSDDTIHRDLPELDEARKRMEVRGGTLSTSFCKGDLARQDRDAYRQKRSIAQKTASLTPDRMFVRTGGGTIVLEMVRAFAPSLQASFMTRSIPTMVDYMNHPTTDVIAMEGKVSKKPKMPVGPKAICGSGEINRGNGVSDDDWNAVHTQKAMVTSSQKQVCFTMAKKMNSQQPLQVCVRSKMDTPTTECSPDNPYSRSICKKRLRCYNMSS